MKTTVQKIDAGPGQRILVMSDIHGHLDNMVQLLRKLRYGGDDILVIVGDLIDKGPDSLQVVRYVMDLSKRGRVYVSMGNVDVHRLQILRDETEGCDRRFFDFMQWLQEHWGVGLALDMFRALGLSPGHLTPENAADCLHRLREHFAPELTFMSGFPTILDMGSYLFVHGGIPTDRPEELLETDQYQWLKNDRFMEQGYRFSRCVIAGHWPVSLYSNRIEQMNPVFDYERKIIGIDGGCGVQEAGQLNALMIPDKDADMRQIQWDSCDGFPLVTALESQSEKPFSLYIQYSDSQVDKLVDKMDERDGMTLCRHVSTGKELWVPDRFLYTHGGEIWHVDNYNDSRLEIKPGDTISVVYRAPFGCCGKRDGVFGWYYGKYRENPVPMELLPGRPAQEKFRRPRETAVYDLLNRLGIPYSHVDHPEARNMNVCEQIEESLNAAICKNLFLRNQQATRFYLLLMPGRKKFRTKELSKQIGSARLSFAEAEYMEQYLHISPGAVSVMGLMNDTPGQVQLLVDREVLEEEYFGCHPCVNTSSIRLRLEDLLHTFLPAIHHEAIVVDLKGEV